MTRARGEELQGGIAPRLPCFGWGSAGEELSDGWVGVGEFCQVSCKKSSFQKVGTAGNYGECIGHHHVPAATGSGIHPAGLHWANKKTSDYI